MPKLPLEGERAFYHFGRSWYAGSYSFERGVVDYVHFGLYLDDNGTEGEIKLSWHDLQDHGSPSPRLEVFDDGWRVLATMPDLISALGERDSQRMSPEEFCKLLTSLGFKDMTQVREDD